MTLENKLGITDSVELLKLREIITKKERENFLKVIF